MPNPSWPNTLPSGYLVGSFSYNLRPNTDPIDPEVGAPLTRVRFTGKHIDMPGELPLLTLTQLNTLLTFYETTCYFGSLRFDWTDPVTNTTAEFVWLSPPQVQQYENGFKVSLEVMAVK